MTRVISHYTNGKPGLLVPAWQREMGLVAHTTEAPQGPCDCMDASDLDGPQWPHDLYEHYAPFSCDGPVGELCGGCVNCVSMQYAYYKGGT